jgi:dTDP-4-dehydrorhamnose reductase
MSMRLLITGAGGMLGRDLVSAASVAGLESIALGRSELDITDRKAVDAAVSSVAPDAVVNCAAWTDVDGSETSFAAALAVNGEGAGHVASAAAGVGAWAVHISSDYVFDGAKRSPYVESDPTGPLSAYGRSKLAGEQAVARQAAQSHTVVRSSWLFGAGGSCFPATILRLATERDRLTVVDDQVGCPTFTGHLASGIVELLRGGPPLGIVHAAGGGSCSWYELAKEVVTLAGVECEIERGNSADQGRPAPRPAYSVLRSERGPEAPVLPHWHQGLEQYLTARAVAR